jgi:hypothetical protein
MAAVAEAVFRGADGSVHYLSSTIEGSMLIITDPATGVSRIPIDGPARLVAQFPSGAARYEAIGATVSTTVDVSPGQGPYIREMGLCDYCFTHSDGHDWEALAVRSGQPSPRA